MTIYMALAAFRKSGLGGIPARDGLGQFHPVNITADPERPARYESGTPVGFQRWNSI